MEPAARYENSAGVQHSGTVTTTHHRGSRAAVTEDSPQFGCGEIKHGQDDAPSLDELLAGATAK